MNHNRIYKPDPITYDKAAKLLSAGDLVSFPTETVYGLGADARNTEAVAKIFTTKNRPHFNPLIIHVSSIEKAQQYAEFNDLAKSLANTFWPGPFTMVLPLKNNSTLSPLVTADLNTVAIRIPENEIARELINRFDGPVAAPSANKSGRISPTTAHHVDGEFSNGELSMIIDGGHCKKGIESTIVEVTDETAIVLRPGSITAGQIEKVTRHKVKAFNEVSSNPKSPGQLKSHYAPLTKVKLNVTDPKPGECLLAFGDIDIDKDIPTLNLSGTGDLVEAAASLFAMMRTLDEMGCEAIAVSPIPETGLGVAINDRLRRAAAPKDKT